MRRSFNIASKLKALQYQPIRPVEPVTVTVSEPPKEAPKKKAKTRKDVREEIDDELELTDDDLEDILG